MAKFNTEQALENVVALQLLEIDNLKNTYGTSIIDLQTEQVQQGVQIADHETRITTLETP